MSEEKHPRTKVAVIGSGLAGLTIAHLLQTDRKQRFEVAVFESGENASLDSASVTVDSGTKGVEQSRVDVPMRALTGGYYRNLMAMYDYLGIDYHWQKFRFEFWRHQTGPSKGRPGPYFIHASDNHECPPPRPSGMGFLAYVVELVFVVLCFFWFTACCHAIPTTGPDETLDMYLRRIWLPRRFISRYLLPLMSAVATCSHQEMLDFPASDVVQYRKLITGQKQYVVIGGVRTVQEILMRDLVMRFRTQVVCIKPVSSGLEVVSKRVDEDGKPTGLSETFDRVITAVPPNVVAAMFEPAHLQLSRIRTRSLETIVHRVSVEHQRPKQEADHVLLKTSESDEGWTEAMHLRPDGIAVTSCPISPFPEGHEVLSRTRFTRTLRTPESRQIVGEILGANFAGEVHKFGSKTWYNGDHNLWVVGAWCFDGMVLLEGAVASAMHVARAFGVEIPWAEACSPS